jgi:cephalosporin hydroxylase
MRVCSSGNVRKRPLAVLLAVAAVLSVAAIGSAARSPVAQGVIDSFVQMYFRSNVWQRTTWLGVPSLQTPCDNWAMQEIIVELKPDWIIETGTQNGGTSLFYASILAMVNPAGRVITVDIGPKIEEAAKNPIFAERVEVITGDSISREVIDRIAARVRGGKVLVTLDSLHTKAHVLREMELYSPFVSEGSYLVVQDTVANGHPIPTSFGEGPMEAVQEFLRTRKDFRVDESREKFMLTFYRSGYLKRVGGSG